MSRAATRQDRRSAHKADQGQTPDGRPDQGQKPNAEDRQGRRPKGRGPKGTASRRRERRGGHSRLQRRGDARGNRFIVITGLSGAGKSQAIRALEDLGYFCVDNLPITLIPTFAELTLRAASDIAKAAVVVDVREGTLLEQFPAIYRRIQGRRGLNPRLIFLEASDAALVRRFSETRRPHPLAPDRSAYEGIGEERRQLRGIRKMADQILDTTAMTVHDLRRAFMGLSREGSAQATLVVTILSFGFKHGIPVDSDLLFDVRFLPNPHFVPGLRQYSGKDRPVMKFLEQADSTHEFLDRMTSLLSFLLPQYIGEGKSYLTIGIGCTGGRHRSVAVAEALRKNLSKLENVRIRVKHRDIDNE